HRAEARGRVGHLLTDDAGSDTGEDLDADAARERRAIGALPGETRSDGEIGLAGQHRRQDSGQLRGVVLAVAVDLNGDVVAVLEGEAIAGLDGAADAKVEG